MNSIAPNEVHTLPRIGFNNVMRMQRQHVEVRVEDLIGPPLDMKACPYPHLPDPAKQAFIQLKRNTGAPDAVILAWILAVMAASAMRIARVRAPGYNAETLALFLIAASEPGTGKLPVYERLIPPFKDYDKALRSAHQEQLVEHEADMEVWAARKAGLKDLLRKLTRSVDPDDAEKADEVENQVKEQVRRKPKKSRSRRLLKTRISVVQALKALDGDQEALLLATEEGAKLLNGIVTEDVDLVNQLFDGTDIVYERNYLDLVVTNPLVCLCLGIQPGRLIAFIKKHGLAAIDSGLLARFLIAVDWDESEEPELDHEPEWDQVDALNALVSKMLRIPDDVDDGALFEPTILEFDLEAATQFKSMKKALKQLRQKSGPWRGIKAFVRKAPKLIARLAAIFTLFKDDQSTHISKETLNDAALIVEWYLHQAQDVIVNESQRVAIRHLYEKLKGFYRDERRKDYEAAWISKTYIERHAHMKVDLLDHLLGKMAEHGMLKEDTRRSSRAAYVVLTEKYF